MNLECIFFILLAASLVIASADQKNSTSIADAKVVICAIVKNEELYIHEWLMYHKYLGFDHVYLYDNAEVPSEFMLGLSSVYEGFVTMRHHPGLKAQVSAYKSFLEKHRTDNAWVAVIDVDEFIGLRKHDSIKDFLRDLAPNGGGVEINWKRFSNRGEKRHMPGPVVARFTCTTREVSRYTKAISYLPHAAVFFIHHTDILPGHPKIDVSRRPMPNGNYFDWENNAGNGDIAFIAHYHTKSLEEYAIKRQRGRVDLANGGGNVTYTMIVQEFERYNVPYCEIEDTLVRDFYLKHYLGSAYSPPASAESAVPVAVAKEL